jgi:hypothetical protein
VSMIREATKPHPKSDVDVGARAKVELDVKEARAAVASAAAALSSVRATHESAEQAVTAAVGRDAIRAAILEEQVERKMVGDAEAALTAAQGRLAAAEAEADRRGRLAAYDRALARLDDARTALADKYRPAMLALLDALTIVAAAEEAVASANSALPEGKPPLSPYGFGGAAPRILQLAALDGRGNPLWTGDQFFSDVALASPVERIK